MVVHGLTDLHGSVSGLFNGLANSVDFRWLDVLVQQLVQLLKSGLDLFSNVRGDLASEFLQLSLGGLVGSVSFIFQVDNFSAFAIFLLELFCLLQHLVDVILGKTS